MNKPLFNKICIVGVGLIGGSIGIAVKRRGLAKWAIGVVRRKETVSSAFKKKAVDVATLNLREGVRGADLVILCAPVFTILKNLKDIAPHLKRGAVVIDVGSTKTQINAAAKKQLKKNIFVGCHPMAGSEKCGIGEARADLFKGAVCFLTSRNAKVGRFWKALGAKPVLIDAKKHDAWVAKASHLPHASSFAILNLLSGAPSSLVSQANPSLKDVARLAQSHPEMWAEIFLSNPALVKTLQSYNAVLSRLLRSLRIKNRTALVRILRRANTNAAKLK